MQMKERIFWIVAIVLVVIYFKKCNQVTCPEIKAVTIDTVSIKQTERDTVWRTPQPNKTTISNAQSKRIDSFIEYSVETREVDTAAILADYFNIRSYSDTNKVKYGETIINDSITQNKIWRRNIISNWDIPVVTKTVSYMLPKKSEIYGGLNFGYNNVGANLVFKDTSNRIWEVGAIYSGKMYYYIGKKWKLK